MFDSSLNNPSGSFTIDYSKEITVSSFPFVAPVDGWFGFYASCGNNGGIYLSGNGGTQSTKQVFGIGGNYINQIGMVFPVSKDEEITRPNSVDASARFFFYPARK